MLDIDHFKLVNDTYGHDAGDLALQSFTASLGVACFPQHGFTAHSLIQTADAALYRAKAKGRNRIEISP